jgi:hypothetical protein
MEVEDAGGLTPREKEEREIALMIVDALWNHRWIRRRCKNTNIPGRGSTACDNSSGDCHRMISGHRCGRSKGAWIDLCESS